MGRIPRACAWVGVRTSDCRPSGIQRFDPGSEGAPNFKHADYEALRSQIPSAEGIAPAVSRSATAVYQARNWSTVVQGSNNDYFRVGNWKLGAGRTPTEAEERAGKVVCVLGETVRSKLFGPRDSGVGHEIQLKRFACEVIGVLKAKGQAGMGQDQDDSIVMPLRTVQRRLTGTQEIGRFLVAVRKGASIDAVKRELTLVLRERRKVGGSEEDDFRVMDPRQLVEALTGTTKILTMLLGAVAGVSLLVGGIGIMSIMLVSVTERTREIRPSVG